MIPNFEKQTTELTEKELSLIPNIAKQLSVKIGKQNAVTNKDIRIAYEKVGIKITSSRVRKIIHYIRAKGIVKWLIASNKGYHVAESRAEVFKYVTGLHARARSITDIAAELLKQAK